MNFEKDLRDTIQALGWGPEYHLLKQDMISSVAYGYQALPHPQFAKLPGLQQRLDLTKPGSGKQKGASE